MFVSCSVGVRTSGQRRLSGAPPQPAWTRNLPDLQTAIPELAKDPKRLAELECALGDVPTLHRSVHGDALVAAIEFKSQVGPSFGNNFNNRSEEAIGTAVDLWTTYREGAFRSPTRPWLGYLMMLEECPASTSPVAVRQPHFSVFSDFLDGSYARRYQLLLTKLVRERLYESTCFLMSNRAGGA